MAGGPRRGSYLSQNDFRVHFGLGSVAKVDVLEVRWPNGRVETWHDLAVDQFHTRGEGSGHAPQMVRAVTVVLCRKGDSPLPSR